MNSWKPSPEFSSLNKMSGHQPIVIVGFVIESD